MKRILLVSIFASTACGKPPTFESTAARSEVAAETFSGSGDSITEPTPGIIRPVSPTSAEPSIPSQAPDVTVVPSAAPTPSPLPLPAPLPLPVVVALPYNPCPESGACVVMPFGDSITLGYGASDNGGYRAPLMKKILASGKHLNFVGPNNDGPTKVSGQTISNAHAGFSGWTISGNKGITGLAEEFVKTYKPNIVTLMIGTNDMNQQVDLTKAPDRLAILIDKIIAANPDLLLVVAKIVPGTEDQLNTRAKVYNDAIPALVKSRADLGKHIMLVDMNTPFTSVAGYKSKLFLDTLHPNDAGYEIMANVWSAALLPLLK